MAANGYVLSRLRGFLDGGFQALSARHAGCGILVTVIPEVARGAALCAVVGMLFAVLHVGYGLP